MNFFRNLGTRISEEPTAFVSVLRAIVYAAVLLGFQLDDIQSAAILGAVEVALLWYNRSQVTPVANPNIPDAVVVDQDEFDTLVEEGNAVNNSAGLLLPSDFFEGYTILADGTVSSNDTGLPVGVVGMVNLEDLSDDDYFALKRFENEGGALGSYFPDDEPAPTVADPNDPLADISTPFLDRLNEQANAENTAPASAFGSADAAGPADLAASGGAGAGGGDLPELRGESALGGSEASGGADSGTTGATDPQPRITILGPEPSADGDIIIPRVKNS